MIQPHDSERGAAMVLALGVIAVLAVLALIVASVVISEKRTELADYSNTRSFYSADAAAEAGINWLSRRTGPPVILDGQANVRLADTLTSLSQDHRYRYEIQFVSKRPRAGWSVEYRDYEYRVQATGASALGAESAIEQRATLLFHEGY